MPVKIISGYPSSKCGYWSVEKKTDCTYFWLKFGLVLVEEITNYIFRSYKCIIIQIIDHREEKGS